MLPPPLLLPLLWAGSLAQVGGLWLHAPERVTVQEGQCTRVSCSFSYPGRGHPQGQSVYSYWFRYRERSQDEEAVLVATNYPGHEVQEETKSRFQLLGDPRHYDCSLDIRDAQRGDTGTYFFRVQRGDWVPQYYTSRQLTVTVTALTHRPNIHLPGPLRAGQPSTLTCAAPWACDRGTAPTFSWRGVGLSTPGPRSPELTLTPGPQHHGTNLTCRVTFPAAGVSTETTVRLSVDYPAGAPSEEEQELHYASLSLPKGTPRTRQGQEASEYSEVNLRH
ncbi:PREDICTED: sialic acid-binding Ig-like lectin 13 [Condylura cristata]|uniref:sialic acid-binding Ig-like lectin 13 n=1 Tax=Condylura cristata TaxID=143302 RepID=UPI00033430CC|nr:PREDICTED: sialic acid-binding Ig-like lectin 13 [Condylura cristata]